MSSNIHIFLGPTLSHTAASQRVAATYHAPAAMGDITRAVAEGADAIILVDGVFESGPSVWHKEIMWAMSRGIPVIGCSSMGALRASELDGYGMFGFGQVYQAYADGEVSDDDEVAVMHAPAELQWQPLTDAMIDIRHRVGAAKHHGLVTNIEAEAITSFAKTFFFKERSWRKAVDHIIDDLGRRQRVTDWINANTASLKQQDCEALLADVQNCIAQARLRLGAAPFFEPTIYLRRLERFGFMAGTQR
jgi:hypothetical protein